MEPPSSPTPRLMYVIKRDQRKVAVDFEKIKRRISKQCDGLDASFVDPMLVAQKVWNGVKNDITTTELDELAAETAAHLTAEHPDYSKLAARIAVTSLYKMTAKTFYETSLRLSWYKNPKTQRNEPLIADDVFRIIVDHVERLDEAIDDTRDFNFDYFGFKTLERSYLLKCDGRIVERPQHMFMRVAIGIHRHDIDAAIQTYDLMSKGFFTHASPTLFNAGTPRAQLSSCFLMGTTEDSIEGIFETLKRAALISKGAGGIGLAVHEIRAKGSYVAGTNGVSNGLVPMLRVYNDTARYVDQGGGKRKGAFAVYLEPWHADVFELLELRKNHGKEEMRARDLFYALWVPDLFMRRVEADGVWSLMCPHECPGLPATYGAAFEALYTGYEKEGRFRKQVPARELWKAILHAQIETGTPYMLYKDACNAKSNQQNLGTIQCSNLCTEVVQYSSPSEVAVCNLASIALNRFVREEDRSFDHEKLCEVTRVVTRNLNRVIDATYYPIIEAKNSNLRHRPIGIGVQGLADTFALMRLPFESKEAQRLNKDIFETIYFGAVSESIALARKWFPYDSYGGSPASRGRLQFDMWGVTPDSGRWDWAALKAELKTHGMRNSLLVAPMPTASTSQILGNNECFEPFGSNMYVRRTLAGEFQVVNAHLVRDLVARGLWSSDLKQKIMAHNGSVQRIDEVPKDLRELYKTVWEIERKTLVDMAADRGPFIDQSQSFNVHMEDVNNAKLTSFHFYAWRRGLKTGMYYLRTKAASDAIKFTVDAATAAGGVRDRGEEDEGETCSANDREACTACQA